MVTFDIEILSHFILLSSLMPNIVKVSISVQKQVLLYCILKKNEKEKNEKKKKWAFPCSPSDTDHIWDY